MIKHKHEASGLSFEAEYLKLTQLSNGLIIVTITMITSNTDYNIKN